MDQLKETERRPSHTSVFVKSPICVDLTGREDESNGGNRLDAFEILNALVFAGIKERMARETPKKVIWLEESLQEERSCRREVPHNENNMEYNECLMLDNEVWYDCVSFKDNSAIEEIPCRKSHYGVEDVKEVVGIQAPSLSDQRSSKFVVTDLGIMGKNVKKYSGDIPIFSVASLSNAAVVKGTDEGANLSNKSNCVNISIDDTVCSHLAADFNELVSEIQVERDCRTGVYQFLQDQEERVAQSSVSVERTVLSYKVDDFGSDSRSEVEVKCKTYGSDDAKRDCRTGVYKILQSSNETCVRINQETHQHPEEKDSQQIVKFSNVKINEIKLPADQKTFARCLNYLYNSDKTEEKETVRQSTQEKNKQKMRNRRRNGDQIKVNKEDLEEYKLPVNEIKRRAILKFLGVELQTGGDATKISILNLLLKEKTFLADREKTELEETMIEITAREESEVIREKSINVRRKWDKEKAQAAVKGDEPITLGSGRYMEHTDCVDMDEEEPDLTITSASIQIFINHEWCGLFDINLETKCGWIKHQLWKQQGIACKGTYLQYNGEVLDDDCSINKYNIKNMDRIDLMSSIKGGDGTFKKENWFVKFWLLWLILIGILRNKLWGQIEEIDYRELNAVARRDMHPLQRIEEMIDKLGRARFFFVMDVQMILGSDFLKRLGGSDG